MRSLGPAGWAAHGFYGFAAKTFGNPGGATSGTGYFVPGMRPGPPPNPGTKFTARASPTGSEGVFALGADAAGNALLVDTTGRVFHSTSGGIGWTQVATLAGWNPGQQVGYLLEAGGTWLLSAQQNSGVSFFRSTNVGATWTPITSGIGAGGSYALATDGAGNWFALGNVIPCPPGNYGDSTDDGQTWNPAGGITTIAGTTAQNPQLFFADDWTVLTKNPTTLLASIWTSADTFTWTEHGPNINNPSYAGALVSGGLIYCTDQFSSDMYRAATVAALAVADPVSENPINGGQFLVRAGGAGEFYVFDSSGNVANSADYINWLQGTLNFATLGEPASSVCYDAVHNSVIAGGSAGSICTVP